MKKPDLTEIKKYLQRKIKKAPEEEEKKEELQEEVHLAPIVRPQTKQPKHEEIPAKRWYNFVAQKFTNAKANVSNRISPTKIASRHLIKLAKIRIIRPLCIPYTTLFDWLSSTVVDEFKP